MLQGPVAQMEACEEIPRLNAESPIWKASLRLPEQACGPLLRALADLADLRELWIWPESAALGQPSIADGALAEALESSERRTDLFSTAFPALRKLVYRGGAPGSSDVLGLAGLPALESVHLHCGGTGETHLFPLIDPRLHFTNVDDLYVDGLVFSSRSLAAVARLSRLQTLSLYGLGPGVLSDAISLSQPDSFRSVLDLSIRSSDLAFEDFELLSSTSIRSLRLRMHSLPRGAVHQIAKLPLDSLSLSPVLTDSDLRNLGSHPTLRSLEVQGRQLSDEALTILATLPQLASLSVDPRSRRSMVPGGIRRFDECPFSPSAISIFLNDRPDVEVSFATEPGRVFRNRTESRSEGYEETGSRRVLRRVAGKTGALPVAFVTARAVELIWVEDCPEGHLNLGDHPDGWTIGEVEVAEMLALIQQATSDIRSSINTRPPGALRGRPFVRVESTLALINPSPGQLVSAWDLPRSSFDSVRSLKVAEDVRIVIGMPSGYLRPSLAGQDHADDVDDVALRLRHALSMIDLCGEQVD